MSLQLLLQLLLQPRFYNLLLHSQKRQTTREDNLMPPTRQQRQIPHEFRTLFEKLRFLFLDKEANLNVSTIIPLERSYYNWSKTWIRLFSLSHTTILPSLRVAVDTGHLNSPFPLPSHPNFVTNFPLRSST